MHMRSLGHSPPFYSYQVVSKFSYYFRVAIDSYSLHAIQHKTLEGQNFSGFGTARKLVQKILIADHTNIIVKTM